MTDHEQSLTDDELAAVYLEFIPGVAGQACSFWWLQDEAESVCNAALFEAIRERHRSRPGQRFYGLFCLIAKRRVMDMIRSERRILKIRDVAREKRRETQPADIEEVDRRDAFDALVARTHYETLCRLVYGEGYGKAEAYRTLYPGRKRSVWAAMAVVRARDEIRNSFVMDPRRT